MTPIQGIIDRAVTVACCAECRFFKRFNDTEGQCRRFPPQKVEGHEYGWWPYIATTDWCGEYEPG